MLIDNLRLFLLIIRKGGLASAGREFGLSPARVSERLAALEAHYNARLLNRSTRSISLTDEGRELAKSANRILAEIDELDLRIRHGSKKISGTIHVTATHDFGRNKIAPMLDAFMKMHDEINVQLTLDDGYVDFMNNAVDLAFRIGEVSDTSLEARTLANNVRVICASPEYLKQHGTPKHPSDLVNHNCLLINFGNMVDRHWKFLVDGKEKTVSVNGNRTVNNGELVAEWCRAGYGIAFKSLWDVDEDIEAGRLVHILKEFQMPVRPLKLVYRNGATNSQRIKLLVEHFADGLRRYA
ncbi:MAG: LysR family transcriptional regulator [Rhizobiaceae bacterium]|nr:LysR family transcriptional regulator [Rhizobiaceae bacterium]